jgi:hypothetical protein
MFRMRAFRSIQEFEEAMFPEEARRKKLEAMSTKELAEFMADEALEKIRQKLLEKKGDG